MKEKQGGLSPNRLVRLKVKWMIQVGVNNSVKLNWTERCKRVHKILTLNNYLYCLAQYLVMI